MNPQRDVLQSRSVLVADDRIAAIGTFAELHETYPDALIIEGRGQILIPGMINTHTHLFQALLKGPGDDMALKKWFTCMTGPAAVELTAADAYTAAMHGCVESIRSGVTTLVDFMYVHPKPGLTQAVIDAYEETGMRGFVCRGFISAGAELGIPERLIESPGKALSDARELIERQNKPGGRVQVGLGPCMIWGLDEQIIVETRALANELGVLVTVHVAETSFEIEYAKARFGRTDTEILNDLGFLGPDVLAVHCVQCSDSDIRILREKGVSVSHNPCSNMYLASGFAPIPAMLEAGVTISLGSDGPASSNNLSLFQAMKFAALMQKGLHRDATIMTAQKVLELATIDGAHAVGLGDEIGSIEVGKKADLVLVDTRSAFISPVHDPVSALVYSALGHETATVIIDGQIVMRDGVVGTVDEQSVRSRAQIAAAGLASRAAIPTSAVTWM
jgi:5-methylthioadenosine/S-adenosylhomocysteine deaminase